MAGDKRFIELLEEMKDLHIRKNAGYAGKDATDAWVNFRMAEMFGVSTFKGVLVRLSDKFIRISNLSKNPDNDMVGESIIDSLFDLAAYCLIAICIYEENRTKEEKEHYTVILNGVEKVIYTDKLDYADIVEMAGYPRNDSGVSVVYKDARGSFPVTSNDSIRIRNGSIIDAIATGNA